MADKPAANVAAAPAPEPPAAQQADRQPVADAPVSEAAAPSHNDDVPDPSPDDIQRRTDAFRDYYGTSITGSVYAGVIQFGPTNSQVRWHTRAISDDEVDTALQGFVEPPAFAAAVSLLISTSLVVLGGVRRSGRRSAAIALFARDHCTRANPGQPIAELAPSITMAGLLDLAFVKGGRYLLRGLTVDEVDDQLRFDASHLAARLRDAGAYLVITAETRVARAFAGNSVSWTAVDCRDILAANVQLTGSCHSMDESARLDSVVQNLHPDQMQEFVAALRESGVDAACEQFRRPAHAALEEWLDEPPSLSELVPVVTAAFLPGLPEDAHERHAADLRSAIDQFCQPDPAPREYEDELQPSRHTRPDWLRVEDHRELAPERAVTLRHGIDSEVVFEQLCRRYGPELWTPLATWLDQRADLVSFREEAALASAIPALWLVNRRGAREVLDGWAETMPSGRVAAGAVSALCVDDQGTIDAMHIAIQWSTRGRAQKISAALAFGQQLSVLVPVEALSRLWHLTLSEGYVARYAAIQFAATVRALSGNAQRLRLALSLIDRQLEHVTTERRKEVLIDRAVEAVATVLAVRLPQRATLTAHILQEVPDQIGRIGRLWAQVLQSWEHRGDALTELAEVAKAMKSDGDRTRFTELAGAVREHLEPVEWGWVVRDLEMPREPAVAAEGAVL